MAERWVYMEREWAHGTYYPIRYAYRPNSGRGIGKYYDAPFIGMESEIREKVSEGVLPDLPWRD
jgi:hypothetical protein